MDNSSLALALFMARIDADHVQPAAPPDQLAILANALDARSDLHDTLARLPKTLARE